ncbi:hypothetical protein M407DRAFT_18209 [Tulasnella calospora MUT 4182]|uniref:Uncharacterized protein n=1 Tax=Tulasnella calospora MUT 4182 TaxID=1051891 RepID=A0A0C3MGA4_9AGAM|nr:hypothetical protein M407DRAFT_18209 [Tulasnella calospora MUT 4182]
MRPSSAVRLAAYAILADDDDDDDDNQAVAIALLTLAEHWRKQEQTASARDGNGEEEAQPGYEWTARPFGTSINSSRTTISSSLKTGDPSDTCARNILLISTSVSSAQSLPVP